MAALDFSQHMSEYETPGRRSFYKYMAPETALAVFTHRSFRYSSPLLFNDPFDVQSGLHFDFDVDQIHAKILDKLEQLAQLEHLPDLDWDDRWAQVVKIVWENYATFGFPRQRWLEQLSSRSNELNLAQEMRFTQQGYAEAWKRLLPTLRVFCVSEEPDNLLMWAHYAKDHKGIMVELMSLPEIDSPLSVAQRVIYRESPPPFYSEDEWLADILLQKRLDQSGLFRRYAQTKSKHWAYEKEWRVWYPSQTATSDELWVDTPIKHGEIKAVYFGCKAEQSFRRKLADLVSDVAMFQAEKLEGAYGVRYKKI